MNLWEQLQSWALLMQINILHKLRIENVYFLTAKHCDCVFLRAKLYECELIKAKLWECEFYKSWTLCVWTLWESSFVKVKLWELTFANGNFMRTVLCKCEFMIADHEHCERELNESRALWMWISWELGLVHVNIMTVKDCE